MKKTTLTLTPAVIDYLKRKDRHTHNYGVHVIIEQNCHFSAVPVQDMEGFTVRIEGTFAPRFFIGEVWAHPELIVTIG